MGGQRFDSISTQQKVCALKQVTMEQEGTSSSSSYHHIIITGRFTRDWTMPRITSFILSRGGSINLFSMPSCAGPAVIQ
jgi:hypothetical protein